MRIACLGWGSLIWSPRTLPAEGPWFEDGPPLPIEFSRVSAPGHVTLVVSPGSPEVECLWTRLASPSLVDAALALARRERIPMRSEEAVPETVGYWSAGQGHSGHDEVERVAAFARSRGLEAVVWTRLPPGLSESDRGRVPAPEALVAHLEGLRGEIRSVAEAYVRNTPTQIDTPNRRLFERRLGWTPSALAHRSEGRRGD